MSPRVNRAGGVRRKPVGVSGILEAPISNVSSVGSEREHGGGYGGCCPRVDNMRSSGTYAVYPHGECPPQEEGAEIALLPGPSRSSWCRRKGSIRFGIQECSPRRQEGPERMEQKVFRIQSEGKEEAKGLLLAEMVGDADHNLAMPSLNMDSDLFLITPPLLLEFQSQRSEADMAKTAHNSTVCRPSLRR